MNTSLIAILVLALVGAAFGANHVFGATKTTYGTVNTGPGCPIHGSETTIEVDNTLFGFVHVYTFAMLGFDTTSVPTSTTISSATLKLYGANSLNQTGYQVQLYNTANTWDEATCTFGPQGNGCSAPPAAISLQGQGTVIGDQSVSIDITSYIQTSISNGVASSLRANLDFAKNNFPLIFGSHHASTGSPVLNVVY